MKYAKGKLPTLGGHRPIRFQTVVVAPTACALVVFFLGLLACSDGGPIGIAAREPEKGELLASLSGVAAASLDANGRFRLTNEVATQYPEISAAEANDLARTWAHEFGPLHLRFLQETHGAPINFRTLDVCGRTLYVRNSFVPPNSDIPIPYLRPYGPWWLVTICETGDVPTISVAVSAWSRELSISGGRIQFPSASGNEFFGIGIPLGQVGEFPISPEAAATFAAKHSGRRVAEVPELILPANTDGPPQAARWRMKLESPRSFHSSHSGDINATDVFVGSPQIKKVGIALYVASAQQQNMAEFAWSPLPEPHELWKSYQARMTATTKIARVNRRLDTPANFEAATVDGGGQ